MKQIMKILRENDILLSRVASVNDFNFVAGTCEKLEKKGELYKKI